MRILVCGSRHWRDRELVEEALDAITAGMTELIIVHGAARGADCYADRWAKDHGHDVDPYAVTDEQWTTIGKAAGIIRNARMLRDGRPDLVIAFTDNLRKSRGTADMVRRALDADVPVRFVDHSNGY